MNKIDIFNANAEFFERFNNSLEDTAKDRHDRTRFTVTGLENKVEFAVTNAEGRIKKAEDDAIANIVDATQSVGAGKYLREGAYGIATTRARGGSLFTARGTGFYSDINRELYPSSAHFMSYEINYPNTSRVNGLMHQLASLDTYVYNETGSTALLRTSSNTISDKNNVLHSGTGTPINTLNVSDMAQEVVNRDDMTVTSGAVYREAQKYISKAMPRSEVGWFAVKGKDNVGSALNLECKDGFVKASVAVNSEGILSLNEYSTGTPFQKKWTMPDVGGKLALQSEIQELRAEIEVLKGKLNE